MRANCPRGPDHTLQRCAVDRQPSPSTTTKPDRANGTRSSHYAANWYRTTKPEAQLRLHRQSKEMQRQTSSKSWVNLPDCRTAGMYPGTPSATIGPWGLCRLWVDLKVPTFDGHLNWSNTVP